MTDIVKANPSRISRFTNEQKALIKNTIARNCSDAELALFESTCERLSLDPFARQIFAVRRWDVGLGCEVMQTQVSIDGLRVVAERSGEYEGQTAPQWCGEDGVWKEVWLSSAPPAAARVGIYRKGFREAIYGIATYKEFVQRKKDGQPNRMWQTMPSTMLAKCAESQAHRKTFPQDLSGIYTEEEMGQADNEYVEVVADPRAGATVVFNQGAADEQAKRRMEADQIASEWIPLLEKIETAKALETWIWNNGAWYRGLHANAKGRIRTVLKHVGERVGVQLHEIGNMVKEAKEFPEDEAEEVAQ